MPTEHCELPNCRRKGGNRVCPRCICDGPSTGGMIPPNPDTAHKYTPLRRPDEEE